MLDPDLRMGSEPGQGHDHTRQPALQREGGARQADERNGPRCSGARTSSARISRTPTTSMACYTCHTSWTTSCAGCHLPHRGEREDRAASLRGRRDAQLRDLQPAGRARRHVPCSASRHGEGRQDRAGALVARRWCCRSTNAQPRAHLHPAAADRRARLQLSQAFNAALPAHRAQDARPRPAATATCRRRTTTTRSWRSCCCRGRTSSTSSAATRGSASDGEIEAVHGHRVGRAAGGDRQLSAPLRLSGLVRRSTRANGRALADALQPRRGRRALPAAARRVPVRRRRQQRHARSTTSPASPTRASRSASSPRRSRRSGSDTHIAIDERDLRRAADQPADRIRRATSGDAMREDEPGAADPSDLQLRLHHRRARKA